jgi:nitrate/nitrite transporter NarK
MSTTFEAIWFKNKETSIAMVIDAVFQIAYASAMFFTHPIIYNKTQSLGTCYAVVSILCVFSIFAAIMLAGIDRFCPVYVNTEEDKEAEVYKSFSFKIFSKLGYPLWLLAISHIAAEGLNVLLTHIICAFLQDRFSLSIKESGNIAGAVPMLASTLGLPIGIIVYKCGHKGHISKLYSKN